MLINVKCKKCGTITAFDVKKEDQQKYFPNGYNDNTEIPEYMKAGCLLCLLYDALKEQKEKYGI